MLEQGSVPHWILAAWCSNPRAPKAVFVRTEFVDFSQPELHFEKARLEFEGAKFIHEVYRDFEPLPPFSLGDEHRTRLVEAKRSLEDACQMGPTVAKSYRTMLARTLYALGDLTEAAEQYRMARSEAFGFQDLSKGYIQDYFWELTFMRALCLRRSGKTHDAVSTLEDEPEGESPRIGFAWWAAKWLSEDGLFDQAAAHLTKESEGPLSVPESWHLSTPLALVKLSREEDRAEQFANELKRGNPELQEIILGL